MPRPFPRFYIMPPWEHAIWLAKAKKEGAVIRAAIAKEKESK